MYKRINITLPEDILASADEYARRHRYTRSALIAEALTSFTEGGMAREAVAPYAPVAEPRRGAEGRLDLASVEALLRAFFSARDDVEAAWVFGSVGEGTAGPVSDVDVAVLPAGERDAEARWALRSDLMSRLPGVLGVQRVDVAVLPDAGVPLTHRAVVRGSRVYGERSRAAAEAEIAAMREYSDFREVSRMLDRRLSERLGL
ncbi:MAG: type II toxin-antitoxin system HicB family antitoxin [Coriobacteriia bacterium]|nr:type II toxin-antitoxin system HicB family antitoxin [Coriobacteriia bacterium]